MREITKKKTDKPRNILNKITRVFPPFLLRLFDFLGYDPFLFSFGLRKNNPQWQFRVLAKLIEMK